MTREQALTYLRVAGYHGDRAEFTRLYVENRVSYVAAKNAYEQGRAAAARGFPCSCGDCARKKTAS